MIKSLELKNFQSHVQSNLEFVPGVNVIIGLSDSGKSAIMNSLRWCIFNEPSGESFRSWWGGETEVTLGVDNTKITRFRSNSENGYKMNDNTFKALGAGNVPNEIQKVINMTDVNVQSQLSSHFLLSSTPGEVSRYFNKIAKLDKIDLATSNINSWINKLNQDIKYKEEDLKINQEKLETFSYLEKLEVDIEVLEDMETTVTSKKNKRKQLANLLVTIESISSKLQSYKGILQLEKTINDLLAQIDKKKQLQEQTLKLYRLIKSIQETTQSIEEYEAILPAGILIQSVIDSNLILKDKKLTYSKMSGLIQRIVSNSNGINKAQKEYQYLHTELEKNTPDTCPFCNQTIKKV